MAELRTVISPKENVAEKEVLSVQEAQTRIKEIIAQGTKEQWTKAEIEKQIGIVINETAEQYKPELRESIRVALATSAQKWHYLFTNNMRVVALKTLRSVQSDSRLSAATYSINVQSFASNRNDAPQTIIERFRPMLTEDKRGAPLIEEYDRMVKQQIKALASDPANLTRMDKNGKPYKVNMRNFAEMQTRYEANKKDVQRLEEDGVDLVWTSSHADASGRCAPYQGRLYSISGKTGKTASGEHYTPLDEALAGPKGDGNGIINGYNCRHRLIEYQAGSRAPKEYDKATIRKENAINNRQRQYERDIRNLKIEERLTRANGETAQASELRKEWQKLNESYEKYSLHNGRPFYEWRTRVMQEEVNQG